MDIKRINPCARWSDATIFNGVAHFVEVPVDTSQNFSAQIAQVLSQADARLISIGSDKSQLLSATIYVTSFAYLQYLNEAWEAWLPVAKAPSRACLKVELVDPQMLVEIAFVAAVTQ